MIWMIHKHVSYYMWFVAENVLNDKMKWQINYCAFKIEYHSILAFVQNEMSFHINNHWIIVEPR